MDFMADLNRASHVSVASLNKKTAPQGARFRLREEESYWVFTGTYETLGAVAGASEG
jgi:hypothetical protein